MEKILTYTALIFYLTNYLVGWLLYMKVIPMKKITHQLLFGAIIINLILILIFLNLSLFGKVLLLFSLLFMCLLPLGKKGGIYHRIVSSLGLIFYLINFFV